MSEFSIAVLSVIIYRTAIVLIGLGLAYFGYKLFCRGITAEAGEVKAAWGEKGITITRIGAGVYFAFFGTGIIVYSLYHGLGIDFEKAEHQRFHVSGAIPHEVQMPTPPEKEK
jgi:hypothetical protein